MNRLTRCTRPFHTLSQHFSDSTSVYTPFTTSKLDLSSIPPHIPSKPPPPKPKGGRRKPLRKRLKPLRIFLRPLETYNPPVPPRSPLLDVDIFLPYSRTHPKAPAPRGDELSPREWALRLNPYAQLLAAPVRNDADYHHRLPSSLLTRFVVKTNPATQAPWILPDGLDRGKPPVNAVGGGGYVNATRSAVENITPGKGRGAKVWLKMVPEALRKFASKQGVWRGDMPAFVLEKMRRRFMDEARAVKLSREVDVVVGGPTDWVKAGETMCVLDFRDKREWEREDLREEDYEDQDTIKNYSDAGYRVREPPPPMDEDGVVALVAGKRVPVHPMWELLGDELCAELIRKWRVEQHHPMMALMMTQRTLELQVWLMRLRFYLEKWFWPEADRDRQY